MAEFRTQTDYSKSLRTLSQGELFEQMQACIRALHACSGFKASSADLLWQSIALEDEIIDRFPDKGLDVFHDWALRIAPRENNNPSSALGHALPLFFG